MRETNLRAALPRVSCLLCGILALCTALPASALPSKKAAGARSSFSVEEIAIMVAASEEDEVRSALESAALLPPAEVLPILEERVRLGLSPVLLDVAIDSLLLLDDRGAVPLLSELARHRRAAVRVRALEALARLKALQAQPVLLGALGDHEPEVRTAAAQALGELGSAASVSALSKALERDIDGAGRALARVARPDQLDELLDFVGRAPLARLAPMFTVLLSRRDLPDSEKLRSIDKLAGVGGDESRALLASLLTELPREASPRLRKALAQAAQGSTKDE